VNALYLQLDVTWVLLITDHVTHVVPRAVLYMKSEFPVLECYNAKTDPPPPVRCVVLSLSIAAVLSIYPYYRVPQMILAAQLN